MTVQLHSKLSCNSQWKKVSYHANELLNEYGFSDYEIFIRTSQSISPDSVSANYDSSGRFLELVFGDEVANEEFDFDDTEPKMFAEVSIIDTLCQFIEGPEPDKPHFKVITGGKE